MKVICTQENFKKAILNSERIVSKQNTLPILNNILIEAGKNELKLSATNLEIGVVVKLGAKVEKGGKITIPAKMISSFIANLPLGDKINLETTEQNLKIKSGLNKAIIKGLSTEDFPLIPQKSTEFQIQLPGNKLRNALTKVTIAAALNETRQEITGINIVLKEKELTFAATDSFRLAEKIIPLEEKIINKDLYQALVEKKTNLIVPLVTANEVSRIIANSEDCVVKISIEEGQIFFDIGGIMVVSRLISGKYPDYKQIIPADFKTRAVGEKEIIQSAFRMASIFTAGKTNEVAFKINSKEKKVFIESRSVEAGENSSEINLDVLGPDQEAVFNSKYFLDGLGSIETPNVAVLLNGASSPAVLREIDGSTGEVLGDYTYIVMPIKN